MRIAAATLFAVAALPALARADKPSKERWFPLVKGAVYRYTGTFEDKPFDDRVQVREPFEDQPAGAANLVDLGGRAYDIWMAAKRPFFVVAWETDDGIYTALGIAGKAPVRIIALPPEVGARAVAPGLVLDTDFKDSKTTFTVDGFEDLEVPAGRYPQCLKVRYQAGAVDGHVWFARGTGLVKWANQFGQAELAAYAPAPVASKSAVDALASHCKAGDHKACDEVGPALLSGVFVNTGERVRKDPARALALLTPSCNKGHAPACGFLAGYHLERKDERQANKWFRRACDLGDAFSCAFLPKPARRHMKNAPDAPGMIGILRPGSVGSVDSPWAPESPAPPKGRVEPGD